MKVLFYPLINPTYVTSELSKCDYMMDCLFHGLRSLLGEDCIDSVKLDYMYSSYKRKEELYGRGFTIFSLLPDIEIDRSDIEYKITNKYFDQIIIPIHHTAYEFWKPEYLNKIKDYIRYGNKVKVIDGNDKLPYKKEISTLCSFFKRELIEQKKNVYPISFAIPKAKIVKYVPTKTKEIASILPREGGRINWTYTSEQDYYYEYQTSWFAHTKKKGGWDCMRHYEILANSCIPLFEKLEDCPKLTLHNFPKELVKFAKYSLDNGRDSYAKELLQYTKNYLTTENLATYVLSHD